MDGLELNAQIHHEASEILDGGLRSILGEYGQVEVIGSYALGLMTWRDLDIHLVRERIDRAAFFALGGRIADLLTPHRMHYRDETSVGTPGLPTGLYWGVYLGDERAGAWKIDIWTETPAAFVKTSAYGASVQAQLTPETRAAILAIKAASWRHPQYRRAFTSGDIYRAVLSEGVRTVDAFFASIGQSDAGP